MTARGNYSGYKINQVAVLAELAARGIKPAHSRTFAEHITFRYPDQNIAPAPEQVRAVGYAEDENVDCIVVEVTYAGSAATHRRDDGSVFHCTLSCAHDAKPVQSNNLLRTGWTHIEPFAIDVECF